MGFCLYGNDIDDSTSPIEAGLGWITKFTNNFVDSEYLKKQYESGVTRCLVGFELLDRGVPRNGYDVCNSLEEDWSCNLWNYVTKFKESYWPRICFKRNERFRY